MGNQNTTSGGTANTKATLQQQDGNSTGGSSGSQINMKMTRSPSGAELQDRNTANFVPIEKLSKILMNKTHEKFGVHGILQEIFVSLVFPRFPDLGNRLFKFLHTNSKATTKHLGAIAFRQQCERFLGYLDDHIILECYIKMYTDIEKPDIVKSDDFKSLLRTCFNLTIMHSSDNIQSCPMIERTLDSIVLSCFFSKEPLSIGYICRWLEQNCPRLVPPIHKFCVYTLTAAYRGIEILNDQQLGLELATPILEKVNPFVCDDIKEPPLMPVSQAWLLAGTLAPLYSKPQKLQSPTNGASSAGGTGGNGNGGFNNSGTSNLASQIFMAKLLSLCPSHWSLIYDSMQHGVGSNRFLHHVLGYKGPTLVLLRGNNDHIFCICSPNEWKETHMYTGGEDCCVIQLLPKFSLIEKGQKMLYLNTMIRGYPKGLRAGTDPRKPLISIDEQFENFEYRGVPYQLLSIEVWGCGDKQSRDIQLDIKKWQVKEAERQRTVKLTAADWIDHPDRYLLELGGRPQYNNSSS